jgi:hypothetical protein
MVLWLAGSSRRARRILLAVAILLGGATLGLGLFAASLGPRRLGHLAKVLWRISRGTSEDLGQDLLVLGRHGRGIGFVQKMLEARLTDANEDVRRGALHGLARGFPESEAGSAVREFESISGDSYWGGYMKVGRTFHGDGARADLSPQAAIAAWQAFCARHRDFPGRDDAGLRLATCQEQAGDARGAFLTLVSARGWGDEDAKDMIETKLANVLDAEVTVEDALDLAENPPELSLRGLLAYTAAVKLAQAHRFAEAVSQLDRFATVASQGPVELLGRSPTYFVWNGADGKPVTRKGAFYSDVNEQRATYAALASLEEASLASDPGTRGRALAAMADRILAGPHTFQNLILHETARFDRYDNSVTNMSYAGIRPGRLLRDERFLDYAAERNHLAQAALLYERAATHATDAGERASALVAAATARVGLVGYWGSCPGHAVPATPGVRLDLAAEAVAAAFAACAVRPALLPAARVSIEIAIQRGGFDTPVMWSESLHGRGLERELRKRVAALVSPPAPSALALAQEKTRGR